MIARVAFVLLSLFAGVGSRIANGQQVQRLPLHLEHAAPIVGADQLLNVLMVPVKCDAQQNLYVRGYQKGDYLGAPVIRISADGMQRTIFDARKASGFEKALVHDFSVDFRGSVYLLASTSLKERRIAKFAETGEFESSVRVGATFSPDRLVALPSGQFLVVGEEMSESNGSLTGKPFTVLVDSSGGILKTVNLSGDVESRPPVGKSETRGQVQKDMTAIELGSAAVAEDGSIYVMRATTPARIYVLDPAGNQVRQFEVEPPGKDFEVVEFKVALGNVVIQFEGKHEGTAAADQILSLVDTQTGSRLIDYVSPREIGGVFACYRPGSFLFLGQQEGRPVIQKVGP